MSEVLLVGNSDAACVILDAASGIVLASLVVEFAARVGPGALLDGASARTTLLYARHICMRGRWYICTRVAFLLWNVSLRAVYVRAATRVDAVILRGWLEWTHAEP